MNTFKDFLFLLAQFLLPHHAISRLAGRVAECQANWLKQPLIRWFIATYSVDLSEAKNNSPEEFRNFNEFFTRELKPEARTWADQANTFCSPVDGSISQIGMIETGRIFQAKGHHFSTLELLGGSEALANEFQDGQYATIYLSPRDYHRIHMPIAGTLRATAYIPGRLFSVSPLTTTHIPRLFARNERLVCIFDTDAGPLAMVLVGAMIVASIETVWSQMTYPPSRQPIETHHFGQTIHLNKGAEMGRFKLGSTVILLSGKKRIQWLEECVADSPVKLGQAIARCQ